jgi:cyclic pyranopterin phosphate synthase
MLPLRRSCIRGWQLRTIGTHVGPSGQPAMVDVTAKAVTRRQASARSVLELPPPVASELRAHVESSVNTGGNTTAAASLGAWQGKKGPIVSTCVIAATMAVKNTSNTIPFCHPLPITGCDVVASHAADYTALIFEVTVSTDYKTGVEMEAMVGASTAALTAYDMLKGIRGAQPGMRIGSIVLLAKSGGKSDIGSNHDSR